MKITTKFDRIQKVVRDGIEYKSITAYLIQDGAGRPTARLEKKSGDKVYTLRIDDHARDLLKDIDGVRYYESVTESKRAAGYHIKGIAAFNQDERRVREDKDPAIRTVELPMQKHYFGEGAERDTQTALVVSV